MATAQAEVLALAAAVAAKGAVEVAVALAVAPLGVLVPVPVVRQEAAVSDSTTFRAFRSRPVAAASGATGRPCR